MNCKILTPERELFNEEVSSVKVPGIGGQFEILANHAALVSALGEGEIRILGKNNEKHIFTISRGFVEVLYNEVSLLIQPQSPEKTE